MLGNQKNKTRFERLLERFQSFFDEEYGVEHLSGDLGRTFNEYKQVENLKPLHELIVDLKVLSAQQMLEDVGDSIIEDPDTIPEDPLIIYAQDQLSKKIAEIVFDNISRVIDLLNERGNVGFKEDKIVDGDAGKSLDTPNSISAITSSFILSMIYAPIDGRYLERVPASLDHQMIMYKLSQYDTEVQSDVSSTVGSLDGVLSSDEDSEFSL